MKHNQSGIIHIGLILLALFLFSLAFFSSFTITRNTHEGQVASARTTNQKNLFAQLIDRGMVAAGVRPASNTEPTEPRPGNNDTGGLNVINVTYDNKQPTKDAKKCEKHDNNGYHGIWNDEDGCYYDHTHGADPSRTIFKDIVDKWNQEISYAWQTPSENEYKHKGYFYIYDEAKDGCEHQAVPVDESNPTCVTHILYQVHSIGTTLAAATRFHSYRVAARVCEKGSDDKCGFIETGGWSDYGVLHCPYKKEHCALSSDPQPKAEDNGVLPDLVAIEQPPYRTTVPLGQMDRALKSGHIVQFWNNQMINNIVSAYYPEKYNVIFGGSWSFLDAWGGTDPEDASKVHFVCEDGSCKYNHTAVQIFTARFKNLPSAPFNGYTDRKGNIANSCSAEGLDCVPLKLSEGFPKGNAWLARQVKQADPNIAPIYEYDVCFDGKTGALSTCHKSGDNTAGWIKPQIVDMSKMSM